MASSSFFILLTLTLSWRLTESTIIYFESPATEFLRSSERPSPSTASAKVCRRAELCPHLQALSNEELSMIRPCRLEGNVALYPCLTPSSSSRTSSSSSSTASPNGLDARSGPFECDTCVLGTECPEAKALLDEKKFDELRSNFELCGFSEKNPMYCCPSLDKEVLRNAGSASSEEEEDYDAEDYQLRDFDFKGSRLPTNKAQEEAESNTVRFAGEMGSQEEEIACGFSEPTRIRNGNDAGAHEHPWNVALLYKNESRSRVLCGGVLISSTEALTAAHCVRDFKGFLLSSILLGHADVGQAREVNLTGVTLHPSYARTPFIVNDIAILHFDPVELDSEAVKVICMPVPGRFTQEDQHGVVSGWGVTEETLFSENLQRLDVEIVPPEECDATYKKKQTGFSLQESQLCASGVKEDSDSCSGDSGSPLLYYEAREGRAVLLGITSFGTRKCDSSVPGVYSRVSFHVSWIRNAIAHARSILSEM